MKSLFTTMWVFYLLLGTTLSQAQTFNPPFPLPTREERLIEDANNPQTPFAQLAPLLSDTNPNVRLVAARALGERGEGEAIKTLEELQNTAADAQLKAAIQVAVTTLQARGQMPDVQANQLKALLDSPDSALQLEAILALQQTNTPAAAQALLQYAQVSNNLYNKARSLRALAEKGEVRAVPLLAELDRALFNTDPNIVIGGIGRARMTREDIDALGEAYWRLRFQTLTAEERIALFEQELTSGRVVGGLKLRDAVARMGKEIFPSLRRFAADKTKPLAVRLWSIELLGIMKDEDAAPIIGGIVKELNLPEELTEAAFRSAVTLGSNEVVEQLKQRLLASQNPQTYKKSYQLVNAFWAAHYLITATNTSNTALFNELLLPYIRLGSSVAATTAREAGDEKSVEPLIQMVKSPQGMDEMIRQMVKHTALTSLGYIGARIPDADGKLTLFLVGMTYDKNPLTRIVAVQALARAAGTAAIPVLLDLARQEKDAAALRFEVSSIYKSGGAAAVEALQILQKQAQEKGNAWLLELSEEALLRLKREKRTVTK